MEHFGSFLKSIRGDMSLRKAAEKSGLSHTYISFLEKGEHPKTHKPISPTPDTLKALANAYEYSYEDLLSRAGYLLEIHNLFDIQTHTYTTPCKDTKRIPTNQYDKNDIRKVFNDNEQLHYNGRILTNDEKKRIIKMIPILINE
ncbi:transcriptional regulator with XRE-family HTH domain [Paenibacillus jamilae]|nr:transcriptional regulator with XRE-family HTH domain [Paenibacillus jamilae]